MEILYGLVVGILLTICIVLIIDKIKKPKIKEVEDERTEEEIRKDDEKKSHYNNMMNFSAEKAYGGNKK